MILTSEKTRANLCCTPGRGLIHVLLMLTLSVAHSALAAADATQIVMRFDNIRQYSYAVEPADNALVLEIKDTAPSEIESVYRYDEAFIRRLMVKDLGPAGTEVRFILRSAAVKAVISDYDEPFRIVIDLFREEKNRQVVEEEPERKAQTAEASAHAKLAPKKDDSSGAREEKANAEKSTLEPSSAEIGSFASPKLMQQALLGVSSGAGKAWSDYPIYIYSFPVAGSFKTTKPVLTEKVAAEALKSPESLAAFGAELFDSGDGQKAYLVYQNVLHRMPSLFERNAEHLWRFAECHLGQGNLTLAEGYYDLLRSKHAGTPYARTAQMRLLDVKAIRGIRLGSLNIFAELARSLGDSSDTDSLEIQAQRAIRRAFWNGASDENLGDNAFIPSINVDQRGALASAAAQSIYVRTSFIAQSLLLQDAIREDVAWARPYGALAAKYFGAFSGSAYEPYRSDLSKRLQARLNKHFQEKSTKGQHLDVVQDYEALPRTLQSIRKTAPTAWAIAESYRSLGQLESCLPFYELAANGVEGINRAKAIFWVSTTAGTIAENLSKSSANDARVAAMREKSLTADKALLGLWSGLKDDEQKNFIVAYRAEIEQNLAGSVLLKSGPTILLSAWTKALSSEQTLASATDPIVAPAATEISSGEPASLSPSGSTVKVLNLLAKRFGELGMPKERRQSLELLRKLKPAEFAQDSDAKKIWTEQLSKLADDYRNANDFLEAGRVYAQVGKDGSNIDARAESLYKGGLLLYRAGRREEAIAAFEAARSDGNNLFYANLAEERLNQIQKN